MFKFEGHIVNYAMKEDCFVYGIFQRKYSWTVTCLKVKMNMMMESSSSCLAQLQHLV